MFQNISMNPLVFAGRRQFLQQAGLGFGSLALASMLHQDSVAAPAQELIRWA